MLTKEQKREQSDQLRATLGGVNTVFLLENRGLSVNEVNELRSKVRQSKGTYKVVKNSVVRLAIDGTELALLSSHMTGPKALAWTSDDPIALAKVLRDFIKGHPALTMEQAWLEGRVLASQEAVQIADLPSRDELIAKLLYMLQSPIRRLVTALNAPIQQLASVLGQVADTKE
jgi:large subunit ribosomal protein L10